MPPNATPQDATPPNATPRNATIAQLLYGRNLSAWIGKRRPLLFSLLFLFSIASPCAHSQQSPYWQQSWAPFEHSPEPNIQLHLTKQQLDEWLSKSSPGTFTETFELQGRQQPANGTTSTNIRLLYPQAPTFGSLAFQLTTNVATTLAPDTPLGKAQIRATSVAQCQVDLRLDQAQLNYRLGDIQTCSSLVCNQVIQTSRHRLGQRLKNRIFNVVVQAKSDDILAKLNSKISSNLQQQVHEQIAAQLAPLTRTLSKAPQNQRTQKLRYTPGSRIDSTGLTLSGHMEILDSTISIPVNFVPPPAPAGCWLALHQSAIDCLEPIVANREMSGESFQKQWIAQVLPSNLSRMIEDPEALERLKRQKLLFAEKNAAQARFENNAVTLLLRLRGFVVDGQSVEFESPAVCQWIYALNSLDGRLRLELDQANIEGFKLAKDITPETKRGVQKTLEGFLPRLIEYSGVNVQDMLRDNLHLKIGKPTASDGWLVVPLKPR